MTASNSESDAPQPFLKIFPRVQPSTSAGPHSSRRTNSESTLGTASNDYPSSPNQNSSTTSQQSLLLVLSKSALKSSQQHLSRTSHIIRYTMPTLQQQF